MGDLLSPKRKAVVDRLRRRIELYRRHNNGCVPRYDRTTNGLYEQHRQETLLLKQRFLEAKAKKGGRNNKHETKNSKADTNNQTQQSGDQRNLLSKLYKRRLDATESPLGTERQNLEDPHCVDDLENPAKRARSTPNVCEQSSDQNLTKVSVKIVQYTSSSQSQHSQTIHTNVTVQTHAGNVKTSDSPLPSDPSPASAQTRSSIPGCVGSPLFQSTNVECKQEPLGVDSQDVCNGSSSDSTNNNLSISDLSIGGLMGDDSSDMIYPEMLQEILNDFPPELMKELNLDKDFDKDQEDCDSFGKDNTMFDINKSMPNVSMGTPSPQSQSSVMPPASQISGIPQQSQTQQNPPQSSSTHPNSNLYEPNCSSSPNLNLPPSQRMAPYCSPISQPLSMDFKLTEPSPAAQTLKQMAEQHQNQQQKQQTNLRLNLNSPHAHSPFSEQGFTDPLQFPRNPTFQHTSTPLTNATAPSNFPAMQKTPPQPSVYPFSQQVTSGPNLPTMKQENHVFTHQAPMNPLQELELRKRQQQQQQQQLQQQQLQQQLQRMTEQKQISGPMNAKSEVSPLSFRGTKPLSHFSEPLSMPANAGIPNSAASLQQFLRTPTTQFPQGQRLPGHLQITQSQHMQVMQPGSHVPQHAQITDIKQNQNIYSYQIPDQLSVSQTQSLHVQSQFGSNPTNNPMMGSQMMRPPFADEKIDEDMMRQQMMKQQQQQQQQMRQRDQQQQQQQPLRVREQQILEKQKLAARIQQQKQQQQQQHQKQTQYQQFNIPPPEYKSHQNTSATQLPASYQQGILSNNPMLNMMGENNPNLSRTMVTQPNMFPTLTSSADSKPIQISSGGIFNQSLAQGSSHSIQHVPNPMHFATSTTMPSVSVSQQTPALSVTNFNPRATSANIINNQIGPNRSVASSTTKPTYVNTQVRAQRPPNVNVGPEGLNISQQRSAQEWHQLMMQNQSTGTFKNMNQGPTSQTSTMTPGGYNMNNNMSMPTIQQSQQVRMMTPNSMQGQSVGLGTPNNANNQMLMQQRNIGTQPSQMNMSGPGPIMSMQMSTSVTMTTGPQMSSQQTGSFAPNSGDNDFSLDFLDNATLGIDSNSFSGHEADLFDSMLHSSNNTFNILDDMGLLGK